MTTLAIVSSTWVPRKMIRSLSRRLKMSQPRSPRWVCSMTVGMMKLSVSGVKEEPPPETFAKVRLSLFMSFLRRRIGPLRVCNVCPGHQQVKGFCLPDIVLDRLEMTVFLEVGFQPGDALSTLLRQLRQLLFHVRFAGLHVLPGGDGVEQEHRPHVLARLGAELLAQSVVVEREVAHVDAAHRQLQLRAVEQHLGLTLDQRRRHLERVLAQHLLDQLLAQLLVDVLALGLEPLL